jgi:hypothetical protein
MKSVYPFNLHRHRQSLTHGGQGGIMHKRSARPITLAERPTDFPCMPRLSSSELDSFFDRELDIRN